MAPGLAEEELERVRRRLGRRDGGEWGRLGRGRRVDDLDPPLVELAQERVVLERRQLVRLDEVGDLVQPDRAGLLARLEERSNLVLREQGLDVDGRHVRESARRITTLSHCRRVLVQPRSGLDEHRCRFAQAGPGSGRGSSIGITTSRSRTLLPARYPTIATTNMTASVPSVRLWNASRETPHVSLKS